MASGSELLRMLEPAVRPGGLPSPARPVSRPIESQRFDQLLDQARQVRSAEPTDPGTGVPVEATARPALGLLPLGRVNWIENASLRQGLGSPSHAIRTPTG